MPARVEKASQPPPRKFGESVKREGLSDVPAAWAEYVLTGDEGTPLGMIGTDRAGSITHADDALLWTLSKDVHWLQQQCAERGMVLAQVYPALEQ